MEHINCFQITSLVLVTMIAIHYFSHKRLNNAENRNFVCFLAFSGVYVLLDMLSAVIAGGGSSEGCRMSALVLTLYYFCDVILTYGIFCYIRIITGRQKEKYKWLKTGWVVLPAAMLLAVTANLRTGWLFYFDQEGRFIRGSFHFLLYGYVFFFMLVIVAFMLLYGKTAEKEIRRTIWRFWFIEAACLFLQIAAERILLTGFGLSVGLWLIYLTMNNPGEYTDSMTGLFDKQYFDKWIGEKLYRKESFHLLAVDARNMKQINRIYGTRVGDQLLIRAAKGFREITDSVQIFRITGNCFLAVLDSLTDYEKARDGIEEFLKKPFFIENEKVSFHAAICGIMNAEKQGMISAVGCLQLHKVCRFIKEHEYIMKKIRNVKFNLSPSELMKPGYSHVLIGIIQGYGLDPGYFQFEITENVATEYSESFCTAIDDFAEVGIHMCLDDFGSGYANLNAVLRIPFSAVKMDRSLLSGVSSDPQTATFYRSIVMILQHMGYKVIAEGAETEKEVKLLEKWGVDMIQGYYFSRPLCEEKLLEKIS